MPERTWETTWRPIQELLGEQIPARQVIMRSSAFTHTYSLAWSDDPNILNKLRRGEITGFDLWADIDPKGR